MPPSSLTLIIMFLISKALFVLIFGTVLFLSHECNIFKYISIFHVGLEAFLRCLVSLNCLLITNNKGPKSWWETPNICMRFTDSKIDYYIYGDVGEQIVKEPSKWEPVDLSSWVSQVPQRSLLISLKGRTLTAGYWDLSWELGLECAVSTFSYQCI